MPEQSLGQGQTTNKAITPLYIKMLYPPGWEGTAFLFAAIYRIIQICLKELGDVAWYLAEAATALDIPLETILRGNLDKLQKGKVIPHNSKCRYSERGAVAAKPKTQIILDVLSSILATQMPCRTPSRSEALRSATAACGGSWRGDPPERCLSRKAGIMRCCRK